MTAFLETAKSTHHQPPRDGNFCIQNGQDAFRPTSGLLKMGLIFLPVSVQNVWGSCNTFGKMGPYFFERFSFDTERRELRRDGELRPVEPQVFDLLQFLIQNRDRMVSHDDIFQEIWHGRAVSDSVLSTRLNAARRAIDDNGDQQRLIRTLRRKGFRFVGMIREHSTDAQPAAVALPPMHRFALRLEDAPTIGVLPFDRIGNESNVQIFAEGLTEELSSALHKLDWLLVVSGRSSLIGKPTKSEPASNKLDARYVIRGSVRQSGDIIRVIVRLIDAASGQHLWDERFDCNVGDGFQIQEAIATEIVLAASKRIFSAEDLRVKLKSPGSPGVWECIVNALSLMNTRSKPQLNTAHLLLRKATAIDPNSASVFGLLSFVATLGVHLGWHSRSKVQPFAFRTAHKAIALNDEDPWGHIALGYATLQIDNRPEDAIKILEIATKLNPNLAIAHYFIALASSYAGNADSAFQHADIAERLKPYDLLAQANVGAHDTVRATASFVAGKYEDGIAFARSALVQSPRQIPAFRQVVTNGAMAGEIRLATEALQSVKRLAPSIQRWLKESETTWSNKEHYKKYVEAFRVAGFR